MLLKQLNIKKKKQKVHTLTVSLLGNMLADKGVVGAGERLIRAGQDF